MIRISAEARRNLADLLEHYERLERPEAARKLQLCLGQAIERIPADRGPLLPAPRPYKSLAQRGWSWPKQGPYWFAFRPTPEHTYIRAVFHEAADIPGRL